jgi:hypothetical protein
MVKRLVKNRLFQVIMLAWVLYWPVVYFVPPRILLELINGIVAALSMGLVVAYAPGIWTLTRRMPYKMSGGDMLVFGITLVQISLAALFAWGWWYRYLDQPAWMIDHAFRGWMTYLLMLGSILHLLASDVGVVNNAIPERGWVHLGLATFIGLAIGTVVLTVIGEYSPTLQPQPK